MLYSADSRGLWDNAKLIVEGAYVGTGEVDELMARMTQIAEAVQKFESESVQIEVFRALMRAFDVSTHPGEDPVTDAVAVTDDAVGQPEIAQTTPRKTGKKSPSNKAKHVFTIDKALDLVKGGQVPFKQFVDEKQPRSGPEKCLIAVYWLRRVATTPAQATVDKVYTCYKHVGWPIPTSLVNTIQQAGSRGWLNTKKRDDLDVVVGGENYVEHELPVRQKGA